MKLYRNTIKGLHRLCGRPLIGALFYIARISGFLQKERKVRHTITREKLEGIKMRHPPFQRNADDNSIYDKRGGGLRIGSDNIFFYKTEK